MPRLLLPTKKRVGIASREEYSRRQQTPYWKPLENEDDDDDHDDEEYVQEEEHEDDASWSHEEAAAAPARSNTTKLSSHRQRTSTENQSSSHRSSSSLSPPPSAARPNKIATTTTTSRHSSSKKSSRNKPQRSSSLLLDDDDDVNQFRLSLGGDGVSKPKRTSPTVTAPTRQRRRKPSTVVPNRRRSVVQVIDDDDDEDDEYHPPRDPPLPNDEDDDEQYLAPTTPVRRKNQKPASRSKRYEMAQPAFLNDTEHEGDSEDSKEKSRTPIMSNRRNKPRPSPLEEKHQANKKQVPTPDGFDNQVEEDVEEFDDEGHDEIEDEDEPTLLQGEQRKEPEGVLVVDDDIMEVDDDDQPLLRSSPPKMSPPMTLQFSTLVAEASTESSRTSPKPQPSQSPNKGQSRATSPKPEDREKSITSGSTTPTRPSPRMTQVVVVAAAAASPAASQRRSPPPPRHETKQSSSSQTMATTSSTSTPQRTARHQDDDAPPVLHPSSTQRAAIDSSQGQSQQERVQALQPLERQLQQQSQQLQQVQQEQSQQQQQILQQQSRGSGSISSRSMNRNEKMLWQESHTPVELQAVRMSTSPVALKNQQAQQLESHQTNQDANLLPPPATTDREQQVSPSELTDTSSPQQLVPPRTDTAVLTSRRDKGKPQDALPVPTPMNDAVATVATEPPPDAATSSNNKDDGCCTCCNCLRRRLRQQCRLVGEEDEDDGDDDDGITCPRQHPQYEEMMEFWRNCDARLTALAQHVERITRAIFPPLDATASEVPSRPASFYYEQQQPPSQPGCHRRRRRRVFIDDEDEDEDDDGDDIYWDEYSGVPYRRPTRRARSWTGHRHERHRSSSRRGVSFLPGGSINEGVMEHRRYGSPPGAVYRARRGGRPTASPPSAVHVMESRSEQRKLPAEMPENGSFSPVWCPSRRSSAPVTSVAYNEDDDDGEELGVYDTQPTHQHPRSGSERSPSNDSLLSDRITGQENFHPTSMSVEQQRQEQEFTDTVHDDGDDEEQPRKKPRLATETLTPLLPRPDEIIDLCDSDDGDGEGEDTTLQDNPVAQGQVTTEGLRRLSTTSLLSSSHHMGREKDNVTRNPVLMSSYAYERGHNDRRSDSAVNLFAQQQQADPGVGHRDCDPFEDNDQESSIGEELIPCAPPTARKSAVVPLKPLANPGNEAADEQPRRQQSRMQAQDHQHKGPVVPTQSKKPEDDDDERIRLLDDFLSEKEDQEADQIDVLESDDPNVTNGNSSQQHNDNVAAKRPKSRRDRNRRRRANTDLERKRAASEMELRRKKDDSRSQDQVIERQVTRGRDPSSTVETGKKKKSRSPQVMNEKGFRGKELVMVQVASPPSSAPLRTSAARNLRDVVPTFDSLATAGLPRFNSPPLSRKRGRIEIEMP